MTFQANVTLGGTAAARRKLAKLSASQIDDVIRPAMIMAGEVVMTRAKRLTPVDTGRLRASGTVDDITIGTRVVIVLGFHTEYATYVHEDLTAHHPVGQAKFLEQAVSENAKKVEQLLLQELKKAVGT